MKYVPVNLIVERSCWWFDALLLSIALIITALILINVKKCEEVIK